MTTKTQLQWAYWWWMPLLQLWNYLKKPKWFYTSLLIHTHCIILSCILHANTVNWVTGKRIIQSTSRKYVLHEIQTVLSSTICVSKMYLILNQISFTYILSSESSFFCTFTWKSKCLQVFWHCSIWYSINCFLLFFT